MNCCSVLAIPCVAALGPSITAGNDSKLCCGYACAIRPETQRRLGLLGIFPMAQNSEPQLQFAHDSWTLLLPISKTDVQISTCLSQTLRQYNILSIHTLMPSSTHPPTHLERLLSSHCLCKCQAKGPNIEPLDHG